MRWNVYNKHGDFQQFPPQVIGRDADEALKRAKLYYVAPMVEPADVLVKGQTYALQARATLPRY